jgi:hypothetical protein
MTTLSCGHAPSPHGEHTTGTAWLPQDPPTPPIEVCWDCADEHVRSQMRLGAPVGAYLSGDGKTIQTWSGGKLADVTESVERRCGGFARGVTRIYWKASGEGRTWHGSTAGRNIVTTMRATKEGR